MALQLSVAVRNAMLDAIESTIGTSAVLKIRTGAPPASVATADSGTVLATLNPPFLTGWPARRAAVRRSRARGKMPQPTRPARRPTTGFTPVTARRPIFRAR
jgi:hypothetical protein